MRQETKELETRAEVTNSRVPRQIQKVKVRREVVTSICTNKVIEVTLVDKLIAVVTIKCRYKERLHSKKR